MSGFSGFMAGKKTYLLAFALAVTVLVLVFLGLVTPGTACTVGLFALAGFAVTFRAALARHQAQVVAVLTDVAAAGAAARAHNRDAEVAAALAVAQDGAKAAAAISADARTKGVVS